MSPPELGADEPPRCKYAMARRGPWRRPRALCLFLKGGRSDDRSPRYEGNLEPRANVAGKSSFRLPNRSPTHLRHGCRTTPPTLKSESTSAFNDSEARSCDT
eukprot:6459166-Alexandrium_andersonii.AAC.1